MKLLQANPEGSELGLTWCPITNIHTYIHTYTNKLIFEWQRGTGTEILHSLATV